MPDNCPVLQAKGIRLDDTSGGAEICRNCLLEKCVYDEGVGRRRKKEVRDQEIIRLLTTGEKRKQEIVLTFNITPRTVQRVIINHRRRGKKEVSK